MQSENLLSLLRHEQTVYAQAQQSTARISTHHVEASTFTTVLYWAFPQIKSSPQELVSGR
jgi:hypothetical protein